MRQSAPRGALPLDSRAKKIDIQGLVNWLESALRLTSLRRMASVPRLSTPKARPVIPGAQRSGRSMK